MIDHRKKILNFSERKTSILLREIAKEHHCSVSEKVRVTDALDIDNGNLTKEEFNYAVKSHFDFVISQAVDTKALFAVEFDGPYHQSDSRAIRRDNLKDSICEKLGMPLLRVDSDFINQGVGHFQFLTYFIDIWFLGEAFYESQSKGYIPLDEIFDPYSIIQVENGKIRREYDPAQDARDFMHSLYYDKITRALNSVLLDGTDKSGKYSICLAMTFVKEGTLLATGCFKSNEFGYVLPSDVASDIALIGLARKSEEYLNNQTKPISYEQVNSEFIRWKYSFNWKIEKDDKGYPRFIFTNKPSK